MTDSTMTTFPELKVGQVWRTRKGDICRVNFVTQDEAFQWPVRTDLYGSHWHKLNGNSCLGDGDHEDDLVSLLEEPVAKPAPSPNVASASPAPHLPPAIANGDEPFYVVVVVDPDGEKLVWETPIPEHTTLNAALERRLHLSKRHPSKRHLVSYIAECRIIPLLTQQP